MSHIRPLQLPKTKSSQQTQTLRQPVKQPLQLKLKQKPAPKRPLKLPPKGSGFEKNPSLPPAVSKIGSAPAQGSPERHLKPVSELPVEIWRTDALTDHPQHAVHFPALPEAELRQIAASMQIHGQRDPIHILPDGVILDGRHRRLAAIRNGWAEVKVAVHHELAKASPDAIEAFLIDCNASRRQLSRLQQARLYLRRRELQPRGAHRRGQGDLRDELAKRFGMSGRNLDRYVALLGHPLELQSAVENEDVSLVKALRLMKLPPAKYEPVLAKLRKGESVKKDVNKLLLYVPQQKQMSGKQLLRLLRDFCWQGFEVERNFDAIVPLMPPHYREKLSQLGRLVAKLGSQITAEAS